MSARWMVPYGARLAHVVEDATLSGSHAGEIRVLCHGGYYWTDKCKPDDGRQRCRRCEATERKAKEGKR